MPRGETRPVPVGASPGARELPQLPRSARLDQRLPAEDLAAASVPAVSRQSRRASGQSAKSRVGLRIQSRVSELSLAAPRFEQPVGVSVPPLRGVERDANTTTTEWVELGIRETAKATGSRGGIEQRGYASLEPSGGGHAKSERGSQKAQVNSAGWHDPDCGGSIFRGLCGGSGGAGGAGMAA